MLRKNVLACLATLAMAGAALAPAAAQPSYPASPVRLVVPQSAGSGGDVVARLLGEKLGQLLGQPVVVENRPGANGVIAASFVAKAQPDGYTLLLSGSSQMVFNPALYKNLPYDPQRDFTYVAPVVDTPFVLVASKHSGLTAFEQVVKAAREKPGSLTYSSAGAGNSTHLSTAMLADQAGIALLHVPFKGSGPALNAVMGGQIDLMSSVVGAALPQVQAGMVRPLLIMGADRVAELPGVPTAQSLGLDLPKLPSWFALMGPAGLPGPVVERLGQATRAALADPEIVAKLQALNLYVVPGTGGELADSARQDAKVWGELIQRLGVQVE
ncbi:tripartite tricarboxylate transporter substrate binding protein [Orrella sp. JC864]|uniref:Bug family tripartite tricarboxylate transporter substrate binding protein n=1 Tax=Orrella sp. JC864 TaxID=3120298 RepID=UPI00300A82C6